MNTNKNFAWSQAFVRRLEKLGVRDACVSPGSRNTPLLTAFGESKKIKTHVFVDERTSAFFALGLAKKSGKPVVIVTTSGTAVAELYPAIIEAYQTCVPIIICTADRPAYLRNTGANQTINQENIFANHINGFFDLRLPELTEARLNKLIKTADKAFQIAIEKGPVHLNFPFEKPLEPQTYDANLSEDLFKKTIDKKIVLQKQPAKKIPEKIMRKIDKSGKTLILLDGNLPTNVENSILAFAKKINAPVIADGISSARFSRNNKNVISYGAAILNSSIEELNPDLILSFGKAPTTNNVLNFYEKSNAYKILINGKGRAHDPSRTHNQFVNFSEKEFVEELTPRISPKSKKYLNKFIELENSISDFANQFLERETFRFEGKVAKAIIDALPRKSILFVGNSTPPRDLDYFSGKNDKRLQIFSNRGASGIDGIISTAAGVATKTKERAFLYVGDLSFFYDLTFLHYLSKLKIPLTIILQNNNGGGIFKMLPIANRKKNYDKFFRTKLDLDFAKIIRAFDIQYFQAENESDLNEVIENSGLSPTVIEIKTDADYSAKRRKDFLADASKIF